MFHFPSRPWNDSSFCFMIISHFSMFSILSWKLSWFPVLSSLSRTFNWKRRKRSGLNKKKKKYINKVQLCIWQLIEKLYYQFYHAKKNTFMMRLIQNYYLYRFYNFFSLLYSNHMSPQKYLDFFAVAQPHASSFIAFHLLLYWVTMLWKE